MNTLFKQYKRRLLRAPWTARRSNESILEEVNPEYSLERLKLKLQYLGHLMWRTDSLEDSDAPHKVLGPGIDGRGIPRGPQATRMGTGLS